MVDSTIYNLSNENDVRFHKFLINYKILKKKRLCIHVHLIFQLY